MFQYPPVQSKPRLSTALIPGYIDEEVGAGAMFVQ